MCEINHQEYGGIRMRKKKKKIDYDEYDFGDSVEQLNASSTTDCTGVMWRAAQDEDELDSYRDVYDFEPPREIPDGKGWRKK